MSAPAVSAVTTIQKNGREEVRIAFDDFHGIDLIDIRVFAAFDDTGERKQTKKGVSLKIGKLPSQIEALQEAETEAKRRRLHVVESGSVYRHSGQPLLPSLRA